VSAAIFVLEILSVVVEEDAEIFLIMVTGLEY
jgi:hypothetical protein